MDKIYQNNEIRAITKVLGVGFQESSDSNGEDKEDEDENGSKFNLDKLRYHRVIIMCDADVDGFHIETLLLTFFFRHMRPLIDAGHLFIACPPLYSVSYKKNKKWIYTDKDKDQCIQDFKTKYDLKDTTSIKIQRYKGLGTLNANQLYETTMRRDTRRLKKVTYEDYLENDLMFTRLMGKEVKARKKFIFNNFDEVNMLDI